MSWSVCLTKRWTVSRLLELIWSRSHLRRRLANISWTTLNVIPRFSRLPLLFRSDRRSTTSCKSFRFLLLPFDWRRCLKAHGLILIVVVTWCLLFLATGCLIRSEIVDKTFYWGWTRVGFFYLVKRIIAQLILEGVVGIADEFLLDSLKDLLLALL